MRYVGEGNCGGIREQLQVARTIEGMPTEIQKLFENVRRRLRGKRELG
jgi:hypothetical protein